MIALRVARGITEHFPMRVTEWLMLFPAFAMGLALLMQTDMFQTSPSFLTLAQWADQPVWAFAVLLCAGARIMSLTINGTFSGFRFSPHMRAGASLIGVAFWSQYALGFLVSALYGGGSWSAPIMYSTAVLFELVNTYRSWADVGRARGT